MDQREIARKVNYTPKTYKKFQGNVWMEELGGPVVKMTLISRDLNDLVILNCSMGFWKRKPWPTVPIAAGFQGQKTMERLLPMANFMEASQLFFRLERNSSFLT